MKIAFIVPGLDPTGPIIVVRNLIEELINRGINVELFHLKNRERTMEFPCPVHKIQISERINFDSFDVIHSHCFSADRYVVKWRKTIKRAKTFTTIHQDTFQSMKYNFPKFIAYILARISCANQNKFNGVIAISRQVKDAHQRFFKKPIKVIYNGISIGEKKYSPEVIQHISAIEKFKDNSILLGTYANLVKLKGITQVLDVLKINTKYKFVIIGDGPYKENLVNYTNSLGIADRVLFLPFVKEPYKLLDPIDIYCMPSYSEGFGLAVIEAACVGKAIVCSNLPSFKELFTDEVKFFNLGNIQSLNGAIMDCYKEKNNLEILSKENAKRFSMSNMADNYLKYYKKIISH